MTPLIEAYAMAPETAQVKPARKRRRRQASYSPSASSSSDSDEDAQAGPSKPTTTPPSSEPTTTDATTSSDSDSQDEDESMDSESDSESDASTSSGSTASPAASKKPEPLPVASKPSHRPNRMSNSPSPPPRQLPSFFAPRIIEQEDERRTRFRRLYMDKLVEGFSGDLEALRASDPSLSGQRLQKLIDSLASGIDVFHDPHRDNSTVSPRSHERLDEVGLVLGDT